MSIIFFYILIATILDSLLGFAGKFLFLIKDKWLNKLLIYFIAFSAGTLIGGAFFHLLPEGIELIGVENLFLITVVGFLFFAIIEGYFHWHQCEKCETHPFSYIMLFGDGIHNLIDGIIIAASFLIDLQLGIITTIMVLIHELPQQLGLFGSLIYAGYKKNKALINSFFAQSTVIIGGIFGFFVSKSTEQLSGLLVSFAAGGFIYIAASDLIPEIHKDNRLISAIGSYLLFLLALAFMYFIKIYFE